MSLTFAHLFYISLLLSSFSLVLWSLQPGLVAYEEHVHQLVKPSVDYVCSLRFPLGNYPPCVGDERDLLVHWCHGAPGVVFMLLQAYKVRAWIC